MNCMLRGWFLGDLEQNIRSKGNTGCHVAMSQRRDAWSTEASQQATQRRDVTMISALASLNARGDLILMVSKNVWTKGRKVEQQQLGSLEKTLPFVFSSFLQTKLLMISRLIMCILKSSMF